MADSPGQALHQLEHRIGRRHRQHPGRRINQHDRRQLAHGSVTTALRLVAQDVDPFGAFGQIQHVPARFEGLALNLQACGVGVR